MGSHSLVKWVHVVIYRVDGHTKGLLGDSHDNSAGARGVGFASPSESVNTVNFGTHSGRMGSLREEGGAACGVFEYEKADG